MKNNKPFSIPIVNDGAIASPNICDGKLIPVLILDCTNHEDFLNLVLIHQDSCPGDVIARWGYHKFFNSRFVYLHLKFTKPVELQFHIKFDLHKHAAIADTIIQSRAVYLQPSDSGAKVIEGINKPKILVEINPKTKLKHWDNLLISELAKNFVKNGAQKKEAKTIAKQHLARIRELFSSK